ncbi:MAG: protease complex subunit PrcB family protein [Thermoanaerobacteraceae bacterium]|nr:protease complex subunit PrcB family protein [Thermoanaerobacteraceae bacterium]
MIQINLKSVTNPPERIIPVLNSIKNSQRIELIKDDNTYYIIATRGLMRTGGYMVNISDVQIVRSGGKTILEVDVIYKNPEPGSIVTQVFTNPYDIKSFTFNGEISEIRSKISKLFK